MFNTADILVDGHPVIMLRLIKRLVIPMGRGEPGEIPGAFEEGIERIRFPTAALTATGAIDMLPCRVPVERIAWMVEIHIVRQGDGQLVFRHGLRTAIIAMDDGNGAAPIALAGNAPVTETEYGRQFTIALAFQGLRGGGLSPLQLPCRPGSQNCR